MLFPRCSRRLARLPRGARGLGHVGRGRGELLRRTRVVSCEDECEHVCTALMAEGGHVGVDLEGINSTPPGLIQLVTENKKIYLMRTGKRPSMLHGEAALTRLLESDSVTKVVHAMSVDCKALVAAGVRPWNFVDTSIAHKVLEYQRCGEGTVQAPSISLNDLCEHHGLPTNPLKFSMKKRLWVDEARLWSYKTDLDEDTIYYSAHDVLYLLEIFRAQMRQLEWDYAKVLQELCQTELLQAIDAKLGRERRKMRQQTELNSIFMFNLERELLNRLKIHELIADVEGFKRVSIAPESNSAHIELKDRLTTLQFYRKLEQSCDDYDVKLVVDIRPDQEPSLVPDTTSDLEGAHKSLESYPNLDMCAIVDGLIAVGRPVTLDVHLRSDKSLLVDVCTPLHKFKLEITLKSHVTALAKLLASEEVVKVVLRSDVQQFIQLMTQVTRECEDKLQVKEIFDISQAARVYDYFLSAKSLMSSCGDRLNDIFRRFQSVLSHKRTVPGGEELRTPENMLRLYYCFKNLLFTEQLYALQKLRTETELLSLQASIQGQSSASFKRTKRLIRELYETRVLHVSCLAENDVSVSFDLAVQSALSKEGFQHAEIVSSSPSIALVRLRNSSEVNEALKALEEIYGDKWLLSSVWDASAAQQTTVTTYNLNCTEDRAEVERHLEEHASELKSNSLFNDDESEGITEEKTEQLS